jgi:hypothetical protein
MQNVDSKLKLFSIENCFVYLLLSAKFITSNQIFCSTIKRKLVKKQSISKRDSNLLKNCIRLAVNRTNENSLASLIAWDFRKKTRNIGLAQKFNFELEIYFLQFTQAKNFCRSTGIELVAFSAPEIVKWQKYTQNRLKVKIKILKVFG